MPFLSFERHEHLLDLFGAVFKLVLELRHQTVAVGQGNLDIFLFFAHLELLAVLFHHFEAGLELVQLGVERIFLLYLLAQAVRHHLAQAVGLVYAELADAGDIFYGALGGHCAKGDYARDVGYAVGLFYIFVGVVQILKVDVDIGHRDSVWIQETLEQQLIFDGVQVGDAQAVGHNAAGGRTTSGSHQVAYGTAGGDIVLDNKEIVREAHPGYGL